MGTGFLFGVMKGIWNSDNECAFVNMIKFTELYTLKWFNMLGVGEMAQQQEH